jgi:tetratricopeptide (TPR) repeat protein
MQRGSFADRRGRGGPRSAAAVRDALDVVRASMHAGRFAEAAADLQSIAREALEWQDFYLLRAECFLAMGQLDEAERDFRWARRIGPDAGAIAAQIATIAGQREARTAACRARKELHGFRVTRFLGAGWEGAVYRCQDRVGRPIVIKQFHRNRIDIINNAANWHRQPAPSAKAVIDGLGRTLQRSPHRLFFGYDCIARQGRLEALYYPYRRLHVIGRTQLAAPELRLALVRAALAGQAHLIENAGMMMLDLRVGQFMLDQLARIRFIDYGASILPLADFRIREDALHVQGLILLLVEVFAWDEWRDFSRLQVIADPPEQLQRRIDQSPGLQRCLKALPALEPFLGPGAVLDAASLTDPEVYRSAAAAIPVRRPVRVLANSVAWELRRGVRHLRRRLNA